MGSRSTARPLMASNPGSISPKPRPSEPWFNLTKTAALLDISAKTLRLAAESGEIDAIHPLPDGPWIFNRAVLTGSAAQTVVTRARTGAKYPTGLHPDQQ